VKPLDSFPAFYGTRRFITAFTRVLYLSLSLTRPIQSTPPYPISPRSILILFTDLRLGLPSGLFLSGFPTSMRSSSPHSCYIPRPSHPPRLDHSNYTWRRVQITKLLVMMQLFHLPVTSSLFGPNILLRHPQSMFLP
jgi:hypothetical protein